MQSGTTAFKPRAQIGQRLQAPSLKLDALVFQNDRDRFGVGCCVRPVSTFSAKL
jgi:hypothetical protein